MIDRRAFSFALVLTLLLAAPATAQQMRPFSPEIALGVRNARIAAVTDTCAKDSKGPSATNWRRPCPSEST